tara:strand:+ start:381 stop:1052 length:672 start_codon:yes stop_codon:yes gene_type:complete
MENSKQLYFEMPNNTALGIEDYIITDSNSFAFDLILRMIKNEIKLGIVSGPSFSGKTHLSKILIKNIGTDEHLYIDKDYKNIIEKVGSSNLIVIENIDKVIENKSEEDLFHIINFTKENDKKLLMTSSKSVSNIEFKLEDLKSRLSAIIEAKIKQPDDELIKLLFIKIFNDKQLIINPSVIVFLMSRLERSYKDINTFIEKLDKFSLEKGKKITKALINDLMN